MWICYSPIPSGGCTNSKSTELTSLISMPSQISYLLWVRNIVVFAHMIEPHPPTQPKQFTNRSLIAFSSCLISYHWIPSANGLITLIEFSSSCNIKQIQHLDHYHQIKWQRQQCTPFRPARQVTIFCGRRIVPKRALLCFDGHRGI